MNHARASQSVVIDAPSRTVSVVPVETDPHEDRIAQLELLASAMDDMIQIPGTNIRVGLDSILGLVPGVGDAISLAANAFLIYQAKQMGVRKRTFAKMGLVTLVDATVGAIPVLGDVFDVYWKSNRRSLKILRAELARLAQQSKKNAP